MTVARGGKYINSEAAPYVSLYNERMVLARLGYVSDLSELDDRTAQIFFRIANAYAAADKKGK